MELPQTAISKESRNILVNHLRTVMKNTSENKPDQSFVLSTLQFIFRSFNKQDRSIADDFLMSISEEIPMVLKDNEVFGYYILLIDEFSLTNVTGSIKFMATMDRSCSTEDMKRANRILRRSLLVLTRKKLTQNDFLLVREELKDSSMNMNIQKVLFVLVKLLTRQIKSCEINTSCFTAYHRLIHDLISLISKMKNEVGANACCTDIKRHEVFKLVHTIFEFLELIVKTDCFSTKEISFFELYTTYILQICNEIKCEKKSAVALRAYHVVYNTLYEMHNKKEKYLSMMPKQIDNCVKVVLNLFEMLTKDDRKKTNFPRKLMNLINL